MGEAVTVPDADAGTVAEAAADVDAAAAAGRMELVADAPSVAAAADAAALGTALTEAPDGVRVAVRDRDGGADPVAVGVVSASVHASTVVAPLAPPGVERPGGQAVQASEPSLSV